MCKGSDNKLIGNEDGIKERWKQYFEELLNNGSKTESMETKVLLVYCMKGWFHIRRKF
jgi:hypothetical protein